MQRVGEQEMGRKRGVAWKEDIKNGTHRRKRAGV